MLALLATILAGILALGCDAFSPSFVAASTRKMSSIDAIDGVTATLTFASASRRGLVEMGAVAKRGKVPSPPRLRHDYSHRADERDWNSDTFEEHQEGTDGTPALNLFVRGRHSHSDWMPCGNMVPDDTTIHLINYYRETGSKSARKELGDIIAKSLAG